jgi:coenzyme F420-0:L-glutamate ligase / coenzyme F420-1:gamma-L-glutamate ligase
VLPAETARVVARRGPTTIVRNRIGLTMAAAGIDNSNVPLGSLALLPLDPDASAAALRRSVLAATGANVAVVVTDTAGRAWRTGQTDIAIGAAGLRVLDDHAGRTDGYGNPLVVTAPAVADELASAGELVQGKLGGRPFAVLRGRDDLVLPAGEDGPGAAALLRGEGEDLFGYGAREAVVRALAGDPADRPVFGVPAAAAEVAAAVLAALGVEAVNRDGRLAVPLVGEPRLHALAFAFGWEVEAETTGESTIRPVTP